MKIKRLLLSGVCLIKPEIYRDSRGYFFENFNQKKIFEKLKIKTKFVQDNRSFSKKNVLRGMHLQIGKHSQTKILNVLNGSILDVVIDLRPKSKTFKKWLKIKLNSKNKEFLFIPKGFAHGFLSLENNTEILYKTDNYYNKKSEICLNWKDKDININWGNNKTNLNISEKDKKGLFFHEIKHLL